MLFKINKKNARYVNSYQAFLSHFQICHRIVTDSSFYPCKALILQHLQKYNVKYFFLTEKYL